MSRGCRRLFRIALAGVVITLAACGKPAPPPPPPPTPTPSPTATPTPVPTPTPIPSIARKPLSTARLFNGLGLVTRLDAQPGNATASQDRREIDAYRVEIEVKVALPRPALHEDDLRRNDPTFPAVFRDLPTLLESARVSPFFEHIYKLKVDQVKRDLGQLDEILTRHNFYDCETILELQHPASGRRALLAIGDMDVNVDGSDGDRNVTVDGSSQFFLPQTSYRWRKRTERPNPFLAVEQQRLAKFQSEQKSGNLTAARAEQVKDGIELAKRRIYDLTRWSFLVSSTDPFIVLPGFMFRDKENPYAPSFGDFAVVIYEGKAYPAIVGDAGPSFKMGEASVLICRELNARSSAISRPVSSLHVAYLVFPGTAAAEAGPPDLAAWRAKCLELVNELGGLHVELHTWPDLVPPWPTPTPAPSPTASPAASDEPSPPFVDAPPVVTTPQTPAP